MARGAAHVTIDASPADVFPWLVEGARLLRWVGGLLEHEQLTPIRVRQLLEAPIPGAGPVEVRLDVYVLHVPWRLETRLSGPAGLRADVAYVLEERGDGGTDLSALVRATSGPSARGLLGPVVVAGVRRRMRSDLGRLKKLAEAEAPPYS